MVDIFREVDTMSSMADRKPKRARRSFTEEFKAGAVPLVLDEGKSDPEDAETVEREIEARTARRGEMLAEAVL